MLTENQNKILNFIPYAEASLVEYEGQRFLVDGISVFTDGSTADASYDLIGHPDLETGEKITWAKHSDVVLLNGPTIESWNLLVQARKFEAERS